MAYEVDPSIERSHTLPKQVYTDPGLYSVLLERAFASAWHFVGDTTSVKVPGAVYPFTLLEGSLDEPLVFTRDMEDRLHLLSNVCTHRGAIVAESPGNERFLRCRYHGRRFGLDGRFQAMPEFEKAENFPTPADCLPKVPHAQWGSWLFAALQPKASFEECFKPMIERVGWLPLDEFRHDPSSSRDYLVRANWALYVDNYLEGLHIPFIHAELNQVLDYGQYAYELYERGNLQLGIGKPGYDCFELPASSPDHGKHVAAYYYWFFPNLMLNFYPWGLSINVVKPLSVDLTRVSFIRYVWRESRVGQGAGAALDRVEREDEAVIEVVQKGLRSRFYDRGRFSPTGEVGTHHFHRLIAAALA